jgi:hypothetical protein
MAASNASVSARRREHSPNDIVVSTAAHIDAMGQNESRHIVKQRNAAIRRAGKEAVVPRPGKLPRRSGLASQVAAGQRRLGNNVLASAKTYDVPSDEETPPRKKHAATKPAFSPLKRQTQQQLRDEKRRKEEQAALDWQLEANKATGNIESRCAASKFGLADDDAMEQALTAVDSGNPYEEESSEVSGPGNSGLLQDVGSDEINLLAHYDDEVAAEPIQQSVLPRRKWGRPSKTAPSEEASTDALKQVDEDDLQECTHGGRSTISAARQTRPATRQTTARDPVVAVSRTERSSAFKATDSGAALSSARRQARQTHAEYHVTENTAGSGNTMMLAPRTRYKQSAVRAEGSNNANTGSSKSQRLDHSNDDPLSVENNGIEQPDFVRPEELGDSNHVIYVDQHNHVDGESDGDAGDDQEGEELSEGEEQDEDYDDGDDDDDDDGDGDDDGRVDATEIQLEPMAADRHRLYGYWHKIREVMREVAKHGGSTVGIKDKDFKESLQACKEATSTVRMISADVDLDGLHSAILQCRQAIARARSICGDGGPLRASTKQEGAIIRKRGFHIFKHLLPALAKLLRASVKAFERVDVTGSNTDQISLDHLPIILELLLAVVTIGENAHRSYVGLSRPIKQDIHNGITIPLRELFTDLGGRYQTMERARKRRAKDEEIAWILAAKEEEREQRARRRQLEVRNQEKWKRMNQVRESITLNTANLKKLNHIRSCPMELVETDADGQPFLPTILKDKCGPWTEEEEEALVESLQRHVDTPSPLLSVVFEQVIAEQCPFRKQLTNKNLLEIVIKANEVKDDYTRQCREMRLEVPDWVRMVPRWMDQPSLGSENGISVEDAMGKWIHQVLDRRTSSQERL